METVIRAKMVKGSFKPLEKVEIPEGKEVFISIKEVNSKKKGLQEVLKSTAGSWSGLVDTDKFKRDIYKNRLVSTRSEVKL